MMRNRGQSSHLPAGEQIRPEVHQKVHQRPQPAPSESKPRLSKASKVFWTVMLFFFISAGAYYLDLLINEGS